MRDDANRYADKGVVVFGVNGGSARSHARFRRWFHLTTPLLVDKGLRVAQQYDAVGKIGPFRFTRRTVVAIDLQGRIVLYTRDVPSTDEILGAL